MAKVIEKKRKQLNFFEIIWFVFRILRYAGEVIMVLVMWVLMQVMVNLNSAHMDPDDWQQPQQFRPERFLDQSGNVVDRDRIIPFSLGK